MKPVIEQPVMDIDGTPKKKLKLIPAPVEARVPMDPPFPTRQAPVDQPIERTGNMPQSVLDYQAMDPYREKLNDRSNLRALLVGATPLLTGFLAGNMGDAYEIASKGLIGEDLRRQKEEGTLMDLLKLQTAKDAKAAGKGGGDADPNMVAMDPYDNKTYNIPRSAGHRGTPLTHEEFQKYTIAPKWEDPVSYGARARAGAEGRIGAGVEAGIYDKQMLGPEGQTMVRKPGDHTAIPVYTGARPGDVQSPQQSAQVVSSVKDFQAQTKDMRDGLNTARQLKDLAKMKTTEADNFLTFQLPKLAGAGQLSDEERKAFTGQSGSIQDWIKVQTTKKTKGIFPDHIRKRMTDLANMLAKRIEDRYNRTRKGHIETQSKLFKMDPKIYESYLMKEDTGGGGSNEIHPDDVERVNKINALKKKLGKK